MAQERVTRPERQQMLQTTRSLVRFVDSVTSENSPLRSTGKVFVNDQDSFSHLAHVPIIPIPESTVIYLPGYIGANVRHFREKGFDQTGNPESLILDYSKSDLTMHALHEVRNSDGTITQTRIVIGKINGAAFLFGDSGDFRIERVTVQESFIPKVIKGRRDQHDTTIQERVLTPISDVEVHDMRPTIRQLNQNTQSIIQEVDATIRRFLQPSNSGTDTGTTATLAAE